MKAKKKIRISPREVTFWILLMLVAIAIVFAPYRIIGSGSMAPTLPVWSIAVLEPADDLVPTDIITFQQGGDDHPTTHTFIGYADDGSVLTKGDANPTPDVHNPPLMMEDVVGKVAFTIFPQNLLIFAVLTVIGLAIIPGRRKAEEDDEADEDESQSKTDTSNRVPNPA
jgi:signal peptidase I